MRFKRFYALAGVGLAAISGIAWACSDYSCSPSWTLASAGRECADLAVLGPGNDTRVNLLLLLRAKAGLRMPETAYPKHDYETQGFGRTFIDWNMLNSGIWPQPEGEEEAGDDAAAPIPVNAATTAFLGALARAKGLPEGEKLLLTGLRNTVSEGAELPSDAVVTSAAGKSYLAYLKAAQAFNGERWSEAHAGFAALSGASDPWLREVSAYLTGRTLLRQALAESYESDGWREQLDKVSKARVEAGEAALTAYLKAYPNGTWAASARGLQRRALWLKGDQKGLAGAYAALLGKADAGNEDSAKLIEEIDNKLLFYDGRDPAAQGPLLLATLDLLQMRSYSADPYAEDKQDFAPKLTEADLAAQAPAFAGDSALYGLLRASHAFYVGKDPRKVLTLIPDDAKKPGYDTIAFSRQVLRGLALAALQDRNEEGFWRELLSGATDKWQRPAVELGLAMAMERKGAVAAALGKDSVLRDVMVRKVLLTHSAGPATLREVALNPARPVEERDAALFTLLYKQLTRGDYAGFVANRSLVRADADSESGLWSFLDQETIPLGLFAKGRWANDYPCGAINQTAQKLAANASDPAARLCLGEFLRLNGFDGFDALDDSPGKHALGGVAREFKGKALDRASIYQGLIANRATPTNERAYALYRMVYCYAPSGINDCGGTNVELPQRRAWFQQLKREYPRSVWARKLEHYW
jgi:hypothetical protein